ncbi:NAD-binding protein [Burkholderia anthina]|uniref:NAD-binding protein n=1 Tax=Burkholderia anthina TaxID=179879 RepID=UPI003C7AA36E
MQATYYVCDTVRLGDVGNDTAVKLMDNMLFRANRVLTIEVLALGAKVALDPTQMVEVISDTASNRGAFDFYTLFRLDALKSGKALPCGPKYLFR